MTQTTAGLACALIALAPAFGAPITPNSVTGGEAPARPGRVWVRLHDKGPASAGGAALQAAVEELERTWPARSKARRVLRRTDPGIFDQRDLPLHRPYVDAVGAAGGRIHVESRWLNAISIDADPAVLDRVVRLPCVAGLAPVAAPIARNEPAPLPIEGGVAGDEGFYGASWAQLNQISVPGLHDLGHAGAGVVICVLDTGFITTHEAFQQPGHAVQVLAQWDFVDGDPVVAPEPGDPAGQANHGTLILGTLAAYHPGVLVGAAYEAAFVLCKTEDISQEVPSEEDNYVAALEFAELHGADIVTSSLLYSDWYQQSDLDGQTAVTTIAVNIATANGLVCCTAMGNAGHDDDPTTSHTGAPADALEAISCGAVRANGVISSFSSDGPTADGRVKPELLARGSNVSTVLPGSLTELTTASGTSLSTPLVAGAVACLLSADPALTVPQLRRRLFATAETGGAPAPDPLFITGYGIVNALAALQDGCAGQADLDGSGTVDGLDLALILGAWGASGAGGPADINHDGTVDGIDLALILGAWGPCP